MMLRCSHCSVDRTTTTCSVDGFVCCRSCGKVLDDDDDSRNNTTVLPSRDLAVADGTSTIRGIAHALRTAPSDAAIGQACGLLGATLRTREDLRRGCIRTRLAACCLYYALRVYDEPFLLVDLSDCLGIGVYALGAVFLELCGRTAAVESFIVADPSLYVHRFTKRLLGREDDEVSIAALRVVASAKRGWMRAGKLPAGLCAAALYVAAVGRGHGVSKSEAIDAVRACEGLLSGEAVDFADTGCPAIELECVPTCLGTPGPTMVCEHRNGGRALFAHGLCRECYDEFVELSGMCYREYL